MFERTLINESGVDGSYLCASLNVFGMKLWNDRGNSFKVSRNSIADQRSFSVAGFGAIRGGVVSKFFFQFLCFKTSVDFKVCQWHHKSIDTKKKMRKQEEQQEKYIFIATLPLRPKTSSEQT